MRITLDSLAHPNSPMTVRDAILSAVRKGVYPWVAAEAAGVPRKLFNAWLRSKKPCYRRFAAEIRKARGWARLTAEMRLYDKDVRSWLKFGPGRESRGKPGWTKDVPPRRESREKRPSKPLADPVWRDLFEKMLQALSPYPEARIAVAEMLKQQASGAR